MNRLLSATAFSLSLLLLSVLGGCATGQGIPPPGGPPDSTAPTIVFTSPPNGTINFDGDEVTIEFSEYLNESSGSRAVVITPIPKLPPELDWGGKELEISFREPLIADRTYAITVGASVSDLSGNRLGTPFTLRFATGPRLDSAAIEGRLFGLKDRRAYIFAYRIPEGTTASFDTLRPDSTYPDFIAPVGDDGTYALEGLPPGSFRLIAVADEYSDQLYTPGTDAFGVGLRDVTIPSEGMRVRAGGIRLRPGPLDLAAPQLYSATSVNRSRTELRFSEPIDTGTFASARVVLEAEGSPADIRNIWRSGSNPLALLIGHNELPGGIEASVRIEGMRDTVGNLLPDSASSAMFVVADEADTLPPVLLPPEVDSVRPYALPDSLPLRFNEAVEYSPGSDVLTLRDTLGGVIRFRLRRTSPASFAAFPSDSLFESAEGVLLLRLGAFTDLSGNRSDSTLRLPVAVAPSRQPGSLSGTLTDTAAPDALHVIRIESAKSGRIYTLNGLRAGPWNLPSLPEGEYRVTAFRDVDGDGSYDYGSLIPFRHAEPFAERDGTVRVRPRWETSDVDLVIE